MNVEDKVSRKKISRMVKEDTSQQLLRRIMGDEYRSGVINHNGCYYKIEVGKTTQGDGADAIYYIYSDNYVNDSQTIIPWGNSKIILDSSWDELTRKRYLFAEVLALSAYKNLRTLRIEREEALKISNEKREDALNYFDLHAKNLKVKKRKNKTL